MALFGRKKLREDVEIFRSSMRRLVEDLESGSRDECAWVFPPGSGFMGGARCGSPESAGVHQNSHPFISLDELGVKACDNGHSYVVLKDVPDTPCQQCVLDRNPI